MRTTIELTEVQRAELIAIAGKRRMKGFSMIVQEAVDQYIISERKRLEKIRAALKVRGALKKDGGGFEERVLAARNRWR